MGEFDVFVVVVENRYDIVNFAFLHESYGVIHIAIPCREHIGQGRYCVILQFDHYRNYNNWIKRRIAESLIIKEMKSNLNVQVDAYKLKLFN